MTHYKDNENLMFYDIVIHITARCVTDTIIHMYTRTLYICPPLLVSRIFYIFMPMLLQSHWTISYNLEIFFQQDVQFYPGLIFYV